MIVLSLAMESRLVLKIVDVVDIMIVLVIAIEENDSSVWMIAKKRVMV
jgi:hypothetical protein